MINKSANWIDPGSARPSSGTRSGRPRDEAARLAILQAAYDILEAQGVAGFTIEGVAARAGVSKTTIYRWWPSKGALAVAAFLTATEPKIEYPDTGSSVQDLIDQLKRVALVYGGPSGRVLSAIIAEGQRDPHTIAAFIDGYARPRRNEAKAILRAGVERGELRPDIDFDVALDALYGPVYYRMLVPLAPLDAAWIEHLAFSVMRGLAQQSPAGRDRLSRRLQSFSHKTWPGAPIRGVIADRDHRRPGGQVIDTRTLSIHGVN